MHSVLLWKLFAQVCFFRRKVEKAKISWLSSEAASSGNTTLVNSMLRAVNNKHITTNLLQDGSCSDDD